MWADPEGARNPAGVTLGDVVEIPVGVYCSVTQVRMPLVSLWIPRRLGAWYEEIAPG